VFKSGDELEAIMDIIFYWIGVVVCFAAGLFATACFIGFSVNYFWRKTKAAYDWVKLCSLVKEAKKLGKL
jgi:ABC-type transporter Mla maintaining outer membrane lipid asymmetry permease subunit MlaE